jgi:hypothetical protein
VDHASTAPDVNAALAGRQQESQVDGIDWDICPTERRQHEEMADRAAPGGYPLASQVGE